MAEYDKETAGMHALEQVRTAGTISMTPELFEQLYLSPKNKVSGDLRTTFGNPTPIAIGGFLLCTTPLSMVLLGWQGAGGLGASNIGTYFYCGGLLLTLGGIGEWILGNTFPATVFMTFGGFWFTFGATLVPFYNAYGAYATNPDNVATGLENPQFFSSFAFFLLAMILLCFVFCIASIRTNIAFFLIFLILIPTFSCLSGAFFALGNGNAASAAKLQTAGASLLLALTFIGWYIFLALVVASTDLMMLPVGDLSSKIKGASERAKAKSN